MNIPEVGLSALQKQLHRRRKRIRSYPAGSPRKEKMITNIPVDVSMPSESKDLTILALDVPDCCSTGGGGGGDGGGDSMSL